MMNEIDWSCCVVFGDLGRYDGFDPKGHGSGCRFGGGAERDGSLELLALDSPHCHCGDAGFGGGMDVLRAGLARDPIGEEGGLGEEI
jgi:hypothetical protein